MMMSDMERPCFYLIRYPSAHSAAPAYGAKTCSNVTGYVGCTLPTNLTRKTAKSAANL